MAEALTIIGLTSAVAQILDLGARIVRQLRRMEMDLHSSPSVFQGIRTRLPQMLNNFEKLNMSLDLGFVSESSQEVMLPVIRSCVRQLEGLGALVNQALPQNPNEIRRRSSVLDIKFEPEVARVDAALKGNYDIIAASGLFTVGGPRRRNTGNVSPATDDSFKRKLKRTTTMFVPPVEVASPQLQHTGCMPALERRSLERRSYTLPVLDLPSTHDHRQDRRLSATPPPSVFMVPFPRDINFVGRNDILRSIDRKFREQSVVALAGLGGIGKSQIAIEYCYAFRDKHPHCHVFWTYGNTPTRFEESYEEIARKLSLPGWNDPNVDTMQLVFDWLSETDEEDEGNPFLLVIDNADDATTFYGHKSGSVDKTKTGPGKMHARYVPTKTRGSILITTRDRRVGERLSGRQRPLDVSLMTASEAKELLESKVGEENWDEEDGMRLAEELSFLPLAITQAAAFISENNLMVSEYLDMLSEGEEEVKELLSEHLEDSRRDLDTENSVMRTWKLSFDQISQETPRAAEVLSLMSVLDYHKVHPSLLRKDKETEMAFRTALGSLQAFHLITVGRGKETVCKMHRLVALSTQRWLEIQGTLSFWHTAALNVLTSRFPGPGEQVFDDWAAYEDLTPHTRLISAKNFTSSEDLLQLAKLLVAVTLYHLSKGRYSEAFERSQKALEIRQNILPHDDPLTLDSVQTIGEALLHRGDLKMARTMLERAVAGREKSIGPMHPDTLESLSDLTITLLDLDDSDAAEVTSTKALSGREKVLGAGDPNTIVSQNIYALLLHRRGDLEEAKVIAEAVLSKRESMLGVEHPETLMTLNNLSRLYFDMGDVQRASKMIERVVAGEEKVLGAEGYDIQVTLSNQALVRMAERDYGEAERLLRKVLEMRERLLGKEHPSTVFTVEMLADMFRARHKVAEAERWEALAVERRKPRVEETGALLRAGLLFD